MNGPVPKFEGTATVSKDRTGGPIDLAYQLHGSGPNKVLLITGISATLRSWDTTVRYLVHTGDYEV
ncbi:hypothetical protein HDU76_011974, partial [Blyttiomyces sp. JEL0837]